MRQAGRSLPEYREIRKRHGLFEIVRQPELCAEVTLQPVRRHGVDAAVMFADIMLPVLGMGVEVELVENVGPVVERPIETMADVERLTVPEPEDAVPSILEAVRIVRRELRADQAVVGFCGGPFTVAGYLVEGRPTRDFVKTKGLMYGGSRGLACADGEADRDLRPLPPRQAGRRQRRHPALRLLGRRSLGGRLRGVRRALLEPDPGRRGGADDPLRDGHVAPAADDGRGRRRRARPRLAHPARRGLGARRPRPRRAGQPRPRPSCSAPSSACRRRPSGSSSAPVDGRATSSTSVTECSRLPTRPCSAGSSSSCTSAPRPSQREHRGRPDGLREPVGDRGHPGLPRGHPRGQAGLRPRDRGADRALSPDRRALAARRPHRGAEGSARKRRSASPCSWG